MTYSIRSVCNRGVSSLPSPAVLLIELVLGTDGILQAGLQLVRHYFIFMLQVCFFHIKTADPAQICLNHKKLYPSAYQI